jgi:hypothetical protein
VPSGQEIDKVVERALANNSDRMRKRRLDLGLSPDIQVPSKFVALTARLNISQLFSSNKVVVDAEICCRWSEY